MCVYVCDSRVFIHFFVKKSLYSHITKKTRGTLMSYVLKCHIQKFHSNHSQYMKFGRILKKTPVFFIHTHTNIECMGENEGNKCMTQKNMYRTYI